MSSMFFTGQSTTFTMYLFDRLLNVNSIRRVLAFSKNTSDYVRGIRQHKHRIFKKITSNQYPKQIFYIIYSNMINKYYLAFLEYCVLPKSKP